MLAKNHVNFNSIQPEILERYFFRNTGKKYGNKAVIKSEVLDFIFKKDELSQVSFRSYSR